MGGPPWYSLEEQTPLGSTAQRQSLLPPAQRGTPPPCRGAPQEVNLIPERTHSRLRPLGNVTRGPGGGVCVMACMPQGGWVGKGIPAPIPYL